MFARNTFLLTIFLALSSLSCADKNTRRGGRVKYDPNLTAELNDCRDEIDTYKDCTKGQAELKKQKFATEQSDEFKQKISNCFTLRGCQFKAVEQIRNAEDPVATAKLAKFDQFWSRLDQTRQNCFTREVRDEFVNKLNICIDKNAPGYKLPVSADSGNAQEENSKGRKVGRMRDSINASLSSCEGGQKSKGAREVRKCINELRKPLAKPGCDLQQKCSQQLSSKCSTALSQLKRITCKCVDANHRAIRAKLNAAKSSNKKFSSLLSNSDSGDLVNDLRNKCGIPIPADVQDAAENIPDSLQVKAAGYVDAQAEQEVGFCKVCGGADF